MTSVSNIQFILSGKIRVKKKSDIFAAIIRAEAVLHTLVTVDVSFPHTYYTLKHKATQ